MRVTSKNKLIVGEAVGAFGDYELDTIDTILIKNGGYEMISERTGVKVLWRSINICSGLDDEAAPPKGMAMDLKNR